MDPPCDIITQLCVLHSECVALCGSIIEPSLRPALDRIGWCQGAEVKPSYAKVQSESTIDRLTVWRMPSALLAQLHTDTTDDRLRASLHPMLPGPARHGDRLRADRRISLPADPGQRGAQAMYRPCSLLTRCCSRCSVVDEPVDEWMERGSPAASNIYSCSLYIRHTTYRSCCETRDL